LNASQEISRHAPVEREPGDLPVEVERVILQAIVGRGFAAEVVGLAHGASFE
jgi:hypothetical protein